MKTLKYLLALGAVCACLGFAPKTHAASVTFGDSRDLGTVLFGIPSGDQDRENYVNHLIDMALNSSDVFLGQTFERSGNDPAGGNYPDAVFDHNGTGNTGIDLGTGGFLYLFAKYDGPNAGSEVWYIGGLTGLLDIPAVGIPGHGHQYGLSGWTLFNPGTQVPDGGTTAALLGAALAGMGLLRRYIKR